jgi:hypothetical protein
MSIFFVIVTAIFVAVAIFLPEWMGITGKKAKKIIEEQQEEKSNPPPTQAPSPSTKDHHQE